MILKPSGERVRQRLSITRVQMAAIAGLGNLATAHGLAIMCPRCLEMEGDPTVETDNTPGQREWKIDCRCRERRFDTSDATMPMDADGELLTQATEILRPLCLVIRCRMKKCWSMPLAIEPQKNGDTVFQCRCMKTTLHPPIDRLVH